MGEFYVKNDRFFIKDGRKPHFRLINTTILQLSENHMRLKSRTLDKLIPILTEIQKEYNLENAFVLDKSGLSLQVRFININSVNLKELIDKRFHYNIEICLHSKSDTGLLFKIIRIEKKDAVDIDFPEPDLEDISDIRELVSSKVEAYKMKFCDLNRTKIQKMSLHELIALEENLCDFISRNL